MPNILLVMMNPLPAGPCSPTSVNGKRLQRVADLTARGYTIIPHVLGGGEDLAAQARAADAVLVEPTPMAEIIGFIHAARGDDGSRIITCSSGYLGSDTLRAFVRAITPTPRIRFVDQDMMGTAVDEALGVHGHQAPTRPVRVRTPVLAGPPRALPRRLPIPGSHFDHPSWFRINQAIAQGDAGALTEALEQLVEQLKPIERPYSSSATHRNALNGALLALAQRAPDALIAQIPPELWATVWPRVLAPVPGERTNLQVDPPLQVAPLGLVASIVARGGPFAESLPPMVAHACTELRDWREATAHTRATVTTRWATEPSPAATLRFEAAWADSVLSSPTCAMLLMEDLPLPDPLAGTEAIDPARLASMAFWIAAFQYRSPPEALLLMTTGRVSGRVWGLDAARLHLTSAVTQFAPTSALEFATWGELLERPLPRRMRTALAAGILAWPSVTPAIAQALLLPDGPAEWISTSRDPERAAEFFAERVLALMPDTDAARTVEAMWEEAQRIAAAREAAIPDDAPIAPAPRAAGAEWRQP